MNAEPPPLLRQRCVLRPAAPCLALGLASALFFFPLLSAAGFRLPPCVWMSVWGVPCFFCGSTRALLDLGRGNWQAAAAWNPLFFLLCLGIAALFLLWLAERWVSARWLDLLGPRLTAPACLWALAAAAFLNWIYLYLRLPR